MDFALEINFGFGDVIKYNTCDFWKVVALTSFVENMEEIDDDVDFFNDDEEEEEEYEYDEDGTAYWCDQENDVWYWYDEESDDWYECDEYPCY